MAYDVLDKKRLDRQDVEGIIDRLFRLVQQREIDTASLEPLFCDHLQFWSNGHLRCEDLKGFQNWMQKFYAIYPEVTFEPMQDLILETNRAFLRILRHVKDREGRWHLQQIAAFFLFDGYKIHKLAILMQDASSKESRELKQWLTGDERV